MGYLDNTGLLYFWSKLKTYLTTNFQAKLVSGTNIKTINNNSLLGSGNISISGTTPTKTSDLINDSGFITDTLPNDGHIYGTLTDDSTNSLLTISTSNNCVLGHGGYANENGNTNIYGNSVYLRSKTGISFEGSTSSNININDLYVKTTHTVTTSLSASSGSYKSGTKTFSKANYLPVAMVGWHVSNGSGSGGTYALPYTLYLSAASAGSATLSYGFRAVGGAVTNCTLEVDILWKRII